MCALLNLSAYLFHLFVLCCFLWWPNYAFVGYVPWPDLLTRLNINDAYVSSYYFLWTNLTYLPPFFWALVLSRSLLSPKLSPRSSIIFSIVPFFFLYLTELLDYLALNSPDVISLYGSTGLNTLLTNTLNRYHPFIFYSGVFYLNLIFLKTRRSTSSLSPFSVPYLFTASSPLQQSTLLISAFALWLGSWWALQEGTWGGWWNWDASETFGLLVPLIVLSLMHAVPTLKSKWSNMVKLSSSLLFLALSYFFIQLNFDLTSHNFGARFFFFFNNNLFFLEAVAGIIISLLVLSISWVRARNVVVSMGPPGSLNSSSWLSIIRWLTSFTLLYWVFASYQPLFNYFFWNFAELNILNYAPSLSESNFILLLVLLLWLLSPRFELVLLSLWVLISSPITSLVYLFFLPIRIRLFTLHSMILAFTLLNWCAHYLVFSTCTVEPLSAYVFTGTSVGFFTENLIILDNLNSDLTIKVLTSAYFWDSTWNFFGLANTQTINDFNLLLTSSQLVNLYLLAASYLKLYLLLSLPLLSSINLLFLTSLIFAVWTLITPKQRRNL